MKKLIKSIAVVSTLVTIPASINYYISKKNEKNLLSSAKPSKEYSWLHGKIKYSTQGSGEPLLLIHGVYVGANSYEFCNNIDTLKENYTVYTLDLLGFGLSDKPNISYSPYLYTSLINSFIKDIIGKPCYVVGSLLSADYIVMAYKFNPSNFKKLILISPTSFYTENLLTSKDKISSAILGLPVFGTSFYNLITTNAFSSIYAKSYLFSDDYFLSDEYIDNIYKASHHGGNNAKNTLITLCSGQLNIDINPHIGDINIPVSIIWGEYNKCNLSYKDTETKNNITFKYYDNCKALPHTELYEEFNSYVLEFLK
jgi:pimeloyl-ACP methyl ester carboxylesterase